MVNINFVSSIFGTSGYNSHGRNLFNALVKKYKNIKLDTSLVQGYEAFCNNEEYRCINNPSYPDGITIMITQPYYWDLGLIERHSKFYGFCVWEGDKVPDCFVPHFNKVDGIFVPSEHTKKAIFNTCPDLKVPVYVIPHGVDIDLFKLKEMNTSKSFKILANKGWRNDHDRGGIQFLVKSFIDEFTNNEDVELYLKINPAYITQGFDIGVELRKLGAVQGKHKIYVSASAVEYKQMPQFYEGDVFVSPTMAESFNIPCAEAMACGIPVITTNFGGQTDFVNNENGWLIDYDLIENKWETDYEGINWGKPKIENLRKLLRYAYENREEVKAKGLKARKDIEKFTWNDTVAAITKIIGD